MARYLLIPGAGGSAWYWSRVLPLLNAAGQDAVAIDLPGDDPGAGLSDYAELVVAAAAGADEVVLVGQSMGAFTTAIASAQLPVSRVVLTNPMIPRPGETPGEWWAAVGSADARNEAARAGGYSEEFDVWTYFLHDVAPDIAAEGEPYQREEAAVAFASPCAFESWPNAPLEVLAGAEDRFFPLALQQRVARERLRLDVRVLPGGHLNALSRPAELVAALLE
jgi:pimeloyl-ACP methyl ester carboxylesterase